MSVKVLPSPTKSPNDKKEYRAIQLPNGLKALLISDKNSLEQNVDNESDEDFESGEESDCDDSMSDGSQFSGYDDDKPEQKQAAAALCIKVGSFSDPDTIPGLAHFLEHMVFMGSKSFPDENHFDKFIQTHGGSDNASTDSETTIFQFEISPKSFKKALEIWSKFFVCPLMTFSAIGREVKAVDAEFKMALVDEESRLEQLLGALCTTGHPVTKFLWGNEESLLKRPQSEGIDVYKALHDFRKNHYLAQNMGLAVQSTESLDKLQSWVKEYFTEIPKESKLTSCKVEKNVQEVPKMQLDKHQICNVVPIKDVQELHLAWFLPTVTKEYRSKPLHYVLWLLAHEGKGSLLSHLKNEHLATSVYVNDEDRSGFHDNSCYSLVYLQITLTENGAKNKEKVLTYVFQYLSMLRSQGPVERIFKEIQQIEKNNFAYLEESSSLSNVQEYVENLLLYATEDVLEGDYLMMEFKKELISDILDRLLPANCFIFFYSPSNKTLDNLQKERWFLTEHNLETVDEEWITKWSNPDAATDSAMHLPLPNQFIPANFELVCKADSQETSEEIYPQLIFDDDRLRVWFKMDTKFKLPKAMANFHFVNTVLPVTPEVHTTLDLLVAVLDYNLTEVMYDANAASFHHTLCVSAQHGVEIKVSGFSDKLDLVVEKVMQGFFNFSVTETVFGEQMLLLRKEYFNKLLSCKKLCKDVRLAILEQKKFALHDKLAASQNLSHQAFLRHVKEFLKGVQAVGLIQGNMLKESGCKISKQVHSSMKPSTVLKCLKNDRVLVVPRTLPFIKVRATNVADENSMVTVYLQCGPCTVLKSITLDLLTNMMSEPCFDILRTQKQLGYSVWVDNHNTCGVVALSVNVQSQNSKFSVEELTFDIIEFLHKDFYQILQEMTEEEFDEHVDSLIDLKKVEDTHLGEEVERNWDEILHGDFLFDRLKHEIKYLEEVTHSSVLKFFENLCIQEPRQLTVQVRGNNSSENVAESVAVLEYLDPLNDSKAVTGAQIQNLALFRNLSEFYPVCRTQL